MSNLSASMASLADPQVREIEHIFNYMDTDGDGRIGPGAAQKLCELLGFTAELEGMPQLVSFGDVLSWCNAFHAQCTRSKELKLTQRFSLLAGAGVHRLSREAVMRFLLEEQHPCKPEAIDALLEELGEEGGFNKASLRALTQVHAGAAAPAESPERRGGARQVELGGES